ncbi:YceI family protein [Mycolicibacterium arabiense]|uniref:YceI family protein n=1 Tax=Mycolicibacterium arabiense TaxID=1286181 RepID=UPI001F16572D|nr:YceI family protein [Mycolicibacterium arabiense]
MIDALHSSVGFSVRHLMVTTVRGRFVEINGAIVIAEDGAQSVAAEIAIDSIDTGNETRDEHLKSPDYFDAAQFPTATFVSTRVRADGNDCVVSGDFTLRGVTKLVDLKLEFNGTNPGMGHGEVAGFSASAVLSRRDFGVGTDTPLDTGGVVLGDKVTITLDIEALKQP